jgi:acetyl-CoA acetyltransferase
MEQAAATIAVRTNVPRGRHMTDVAIIGVGLHPFGRFPDKTPFDMAVEATDAALADAGLSWRDIQFGAAGSLEVQLPDCITRFLGLTGIQFTSVFNACATAATTVQLAAEAIKLGKADIAIAVGMDKHPRGAFGSDPANMGLPRWYGESGLHTTPKFFGMKANKYIHDHGIDEITLGRIAAKSFRNGEKNPMAFRRKPISVEEIMASPVLTYPLRQYMFCQPDEGAGAIVVCRADKAHEYTDTPIYIRASEIRQRTYGAYESHSISASVHEKESPTVFASKAAFESAGIGPKDIDVIQLQDTEAGAELMHMAETGFCEHGEQDKLLAEGATEIGGSMPINTDGGLIANGEPIGASGIRQVYELTLQLRGQAGERQVPGNPKTGFAQVYGAPGLAAATILSR